MFDKFQALIQKIFQSKNRVKVPTILQMEATECGAASLSMILSHYGLWLPLDTAGMRRQPRRLQSQQRHSRRQKPRLYC